MANYTRETYAGRAEVPRGWRWGKNRAAFSPLEKVKEEIIDGLEFGILIFPQIQLLDLAGPYEVFAALPDVGVNLIWKNTISVASSSGIPIAPTVTFESCPALDLLCVPGGGGINALLEDQETLTFIREQAAHTRYVTSVCTGSLVLGAAGLLRGVRLRRTGIRMICFHMLALFRHQAAWSATVILLLPEALHQAQRGCRSLWRRYSAIDPTCSGVRTGSAVQFRHTGNSHGGSARRHQATDVEITGRA